MGVLGKAFKKHMSWALKNKFAFGSEAMEPVLNRPSWRWEEHGLWTLENSGGTMRVNQVRGSLQPGHEGIRTSPYGEHLGLCIVANFLPPIRTPPKCSQYLP